MAQTRLDQKLLSKIAKKIGKDLPNVRVRVSRIAAKLGISSEAALIILAKELGIGTAASQRRLDPSKQAEVRDSLPNVISRTYSSGKTSVKKKGTSGSGGNRKAAIKATIEYLLQDEDLRQRCSDLLLAKSHFDRAINQGTLLLEDRIRKKAKPNNGMVGENLIGYAFNAEISKSVLKISKNADEQRGYAAILRGVVPAFRNPTHHHVIETFTREEAIRVCAFIDVLLRVVDNSTKSIDIMA